MNLMQRQRENWNKVKIDLEHDVYSQQHQYVKF